GEAGHSSCLARLGYPGPLGRFLGNLTQASELKQRESERRTVSGSSTRSGAGSPPGASVPQSNGAFADCGGSFVEASLVQAPPLREGFGKAGVCVAADDVGFAKQARYAQGLRVSQSRVDVVLSVFEGARGYRMG